MWSEVSLVEESTAFVVVSTLVSLKRAQLYLLSGEPAGRIPAARPSCAIARANNRERRELLRRGFISANKRFAAGEETDE